MAGTISGFKNATAAAYSSGNQIDSSERGMLVDAFRRLTTTDQGQALEYLLAKNFDGTYGAVAEHATGACMSLDGFKNGVASAYSSGNQIDTSERSTLVDAFRRLSTNDKGMALEYLQAKNFDGTYAACSELATGAKMSLDGFRNGVSASYSSGYQIDTSERATLVDAFRRLTTNDKGQALEFLLAKNFDGTYGAVSEFASGACMSLDGFKNGVSSAYSSGNQIDTSERSTLVDAFRRLSTNDKGLALEHLLAKNFDGTYGAVSEFATGACVSLNGFKNGVSAAYSSGNQIDTSERSVLVDAFRRLSANDKEAALEHLASKNFDNTYKACAEFA